MKSIVNLLVGLILILVAGGVAWYFYSNHRLSDERQKAQLTRDSANLVIEQAHRDLKVRDDSIRAKDERIRQRDKQDSILIVQLEKSNKYYEKVARSYRNAPMSRLDSFLVARYPDSASVAQRIYGGRTDSIR